jgi:hypothetical protein
MDAYISQAEIKGQTSRSGSATNVLRNINDLENLDREIPQRLLAKKAEKLSTAVYLITGFLSDNEPIKWKIREGSLKVLSDINLIGGSVMSEREQHIKSLNSEVGRIASLLEIAVVAGFVSGMNFAILKEEYHSLIEAIRQQKISTPEGSYIFAPEFFSISDIVPSIRTQEKTELKTGGKKGQTERQSIIAPNEIIKDNQENLPHSPEDFSRNTPPKNVEKRSRRETILRLIKDKGEATEVSIKDIVGHFSDCGEKTIQRELTALVEEGVLKKTGERRWSRYSLS